MSNPIWYQRTLERIEHDYADGLISKAEYDERVRELNEDLHFQNAVDEAFKDYMGY